MPIPRLQTTATRKRLKVGQQQPIVSNSEPSLDNLNDYCLSRIIGELLTLVSQPLNHQQTVKSRDTSNTERTLCLVSRRWYWLTKTLIRTHGVHGINLNRLQRKTLANQSVNKLISRGRQHSIDLFRLVHPRLLECENIQLQGSLSSEDFKKLVVGLDSARTKRLHLNLSITKDRMRSVDFNDLPVHLNNLDTLSVIWSNDRASDFSNGLTWTLFNRSINLKSIEIQLDERTGEDNVNKDSGDESVAKVLDTFTQSSLRPMGDLRPDHCHLERLVFKRTLDEPPVNCAYSNLVIGTIAREDYIQKVETNDNQVIEYLIHSSERICTSRELKSLELLSPIKNLVLLRKLVESKTLGTEYLSFVIDSIDNIEEIRQTMELFGRYRDQTAICHITLHTKDQKYSEPEEVIKNIVLLSRMARAEIHIQAQQRISIDCCHLMWSVGRALQSDSTIGIHFSATRGQCLFKIIGSGVGQASIGRPQNSNSMVTIPFGFASEYRINRNLEDVNRHREIMRSVKRNCYNSFVKSVRDNNPATKYSN